jgi:hypothetical protein
VGFAPDSHGAPVAYPQENHGAYAVLRTKRNLSLRSVKHSVITAYLEVQVQLNAFLTSLLVRRVW